MKCPDCGASVFRADLPGGIEAMMDLEPVKFTQERVLYTMDHPADPCGLYKRVGSYCTSKDAGRMFLYQTHDCHPTPNQRPWRDSDGYNGR